MVRFLFLIFGFDAQKGLNDSSLEIDSQIVRAHFSKLAKKGEQLFCEAWKASKFPSVSSPSSQKCDRPFCPAGIFALAKLPCGVCAMVKALDLAHEKANELRRMGIREGCRISLIQSNDPMVVVVENSRIAIGHQVARHIKVESITS